MVKSKSVLSAIALVACGFVQTETAGAFTMAALDIQLSYAVEFNQGFNQPVTQIVTFNRYVDGGVGAWWPAQLNPQTGGTSYTDPFLKSSSNAPLSAMGLGLVSNLPGDAPGQKHVVMLMSEQAASASANIAWGTLFRNTLEEQVIADLEMAIGTTRPDENVDSVGAAQWDSALNNLFDFATGDAANGISGPGGLPISAWFDFGAVPVGPGSVTTGFKAMAFSVGQEIGSGQATLSTQPAPVPVPAAIWLFGSTLGGLGVWRKLFGSKA